MKGGEEASLTDRSRSGCMKEKVNGDPPHHRPLGPHRYLHVTTRNGHPNLAPHSPSPVQVQIPGAGYYTECRAEATSCLLVTLLHGPLQNSFSPPCSPRCRQKQRRHLNGTIFVIDYPHSTQSKQYKESQLKLNGHGLLNLPSS